MDGTYGFKYTGDSQKEVSVFINEFDTFVKRGNFYRFTEHEINEYVLAKVITQDGLNIDVARRHYSNIAVWVSGIKPEQPPPPIRNLYDLSREFYLFIEYYTYGLMFRFIYNHIPYNQNNKGKFEHRSDELYNLVVIAIQEKGTRDLVLKAFRSIPTNHIN